MTIIGGGPQNIGPLQKSDEGPSISLRLNQRISAEVLQVSGDQVELSVQGVRVVAKMTSSEQAAQLIEHKFSQFIIKDVNQNGLTLQLVSGKAGRPAEMPPNLALLANALLQDANIPATDSSRQLVQMMLSRSLTASPETLHKLADLLAKIKNPDQADLNAILQLVQKGLPLSPGAVNLLKTGSPNISEPLLRLQTMLAELASRPDLPEQTRQLLNNTLDLLGKLIVQYNGSTEELSQKLNNAVNTLSASMEKDILRIIGGNQKPQGEEQTTSLINLLAQLRNQMALRGETDLAAQLDGFILQFQNYLDASLTSGKEPSAQDWLNLIQPMFAKLRDLALQSKFPEPLQNLLNQVVDTLGALTQSYENAIIRQGEVPLPPPVQTSLLPDTSPLKLNPPLDVFPALKEWLISSPGIQSALSSNPLLDGVDFSTFSQQELQTFMDALRLLQTQLGENDLQLSGQIGKLLDQLQNLYSAHNLRTEDNLQTIWRQSILPMLDQLVNLVVNTNLPAETSDLIRQVLQEFAKLFQSRLPGADLQGDIQKRDLIQQALQQNQTSLMTTLGALRKDIHSRGGQDSLVNDLDNFMESMRYIQFTNVRPENEPPHGEWISLNLPVQFQSDCQAYAPTHLRVAYRTTKHGRKADPDFTRLVIQVDITPQNTLDIDMSIARKRVGAQITASSEKLRQAAEKELPSLQNGLSKAGFSLVTTRFLVGEPEKVIREESETSETSRTTSPAGGTDVEV